MFIAMNRFRIADGSEEAFEAVWKTRRSRLAEMPGFRAFHLLKGPKAEDHTLYASHTVWESEDHFAAWTKSDQFREAHAKAGERPVRYLGHPVFEGFTTVEGA
jgi:heme-degrading monooxygenase HmoA